MIFEEDIFLENERVLLRPLEETDLTFLLPIAENTPDLLKFSPSKFGTEDNLKQYISSALNQRHREQRYPFIIYDKKFNKFAGSTSLGNISLYDKRLEIGWTWIGKEFQRSGLNKNCKYLLLEFVFMKLKFERIEFKIDSRNTSSKKAVEAIGGIFEGILRSHTLMQDGFRRNTVYYSILREEYYK